MLAVCGLRGICEHQLYIIVQVWECMKEESSLLWCCTNLISLCHLLLNLDDGGSWRSWHIWTIWSSLLWITASFLLISLLSSSISFMLVKLLLMNESNVLSEWNLCDLLLLLASRVGIISVGDSSAILLRESFSCVTFCTFSCRNLISSVNAAILYWYFVIWSLVSNCSSMFLILRVWYFFLLISFCDLSSSMHIDCSLITAFCFSISSLFVVRSLLNCWISSVDDWSTDTLWLYESCEEPVSWDEWLKLLALLSLMYLSSSDEKHVAVLMVLVREVIPRPANAAVLSGGVGINRGDCEMASY